MRFTLICNIRKVVKGICCILFLWLIYAKIDVIIMIEEVWGMESKRNYGIDLLRLVLMFMVCLLHILGQGGVLTASPRGTAGYGVFWFLEVCAYCAVDGFAIISGYVSSNRAPKWDKLVNMWFQVIFYSFVLTAILGLLNIGANVGKTALIKSLLPVTCNYFWYFTAYFALFFAMPMLNMFIEYLDIKTARKAMLISIVMFSVIGFPADAFKLQKGYSTIWLVILYFMGGLAKKTDLFSGKKTVALIIAFLALSVISWGERMIFDSDRLIRYNSPTILLNGLILVVLFSRIKIKGTLVKKLSPLAFGIYLFQLNSVIWNDVLKGSTAFIAEKPVWVGICYAIAFALALFITGLIVEALRNQIAKALRIQIISLKIADMFNGILSKVILLLR